MSVLRYWRTGVASIVGILIIGGITYGVLMALGVDFGSGGSAQEEVDQQQGKHSAPNRDRLAICVQSVGLGSGEATAAVEVSAKTSVELALQEVVKHPGWAPFAKEPPPIVDIGCGTQPAVYNPHPDFGDGPPGSFFQVDGREVSEASYYRVLVFVLPPNEISRFLGDPPFRLTIEEKLCSGDSCRHVTTGLYLSPDELANLPLITDSLEKAAALERPF